MIIAVDPGPETCGLVAYCPDRQQVTYANAAEPVADVLEVLTTWHPPGCDVYIERVQSYGIAGGSLLRTSEVVGRLWQAARSAGRPVRLIYRREVLRALDVTGKGNRDTLVRHRLIEQFGGTAKAAKGTRAAPGPLHGVSSHSWAALAVAIAGGLGAGEVQL